MPAPGVEAGRGGLRALARARPRRPAPALRAAGPRATPVPRAVAAAARAARPDLHQARPDPEPARGHPAAAESPRSSSTCSTACRRCRSTASASSSSATSAGPLDEMFAWVDRRSRSARPRSRRSTARPRATATPVVIKVVKPGIRETLRRDARLLRTLGRCAADACSRATSPKRIIREFSDYTLREVDLRREADNAETFAANFVDQPDIVFPKIYREYQRPRACCTMEFFDGLRPDSPAGAGAAARGARAAGRPRRRGHHPDDLPGRLLPRRPASREPAGAARPEGRVHRPRHGRAAGRRAPPHAALLLLLPGHGRRRERRALPLGGGRARPRRRPAGLPPRGGGDLRPLAARRDLRQLLPRPADPGVGDPRARSTGCTSRSRWC